MSLDSLHKKIRAINTLVSDRNLVGLYGELDATGDCEHIGVLIKCDDVPILFHFKRSGVRLEPVPNVDEEQYYIQLNLYLDDKEVAEFYSYCNFLKRKISNNNSRFSYIFDDSKFSMGCKEDVRWFSD